MNMKDILAGGALLAALTLIQISPIKLDPWTWLAKLAAKLAGAVGRAFNHSLMTKMTEVEQKVDGLEQKIDAVEQKVDAVQGDAQVQAAINARSRILRFGDEVLHDRKHTKDHFDSVLRDARMYERYCAAHPEFENGVTEPTIQRIKDVYAGRLEKNDFL